MLAGEQSRMMLYFVPQLGPAPRWCSFLEGLTEELEETAGQNVYEDYKFVTKTEVEELGASGLIGTPMLKGYMHGFFMEMKLYNKLRAVSKPFEYEEHRKKKIEGKIEEKRQSRIIAQKRLPKVNKDLAEKMIKLSTALKAKSGVDTEKDSSGGSADSIIDTRFASLFQREEFERDETSSEFKLRNPSKGHNQRKSGNDDSDDELQNLYAPVEEVDDEDSGEDDSDDQGSDDEDVGKGGRERGTKPHDDDDSDIDQIRNEDDEDEVKVKSRKRKGGKGDNSDEEGEIFKATKRALERRRDSEARSASTSVPKVKKGPSSTQSAKSKSTARTSGGPKMYEIADGVSSSRAVFSHTEESKGQRRADKAISAVPLSDRVKASGKVTPQSNRIFIFHLISHHTYIAPPPTLRLSACWRN